MPIALRPRKLHSDCSNPVGFSLPQIRFAEFELDLDLFKLERSGRRVPLGPRALDLLAYLIQHRRRVVSAETLRAEVWSGIALSESTIATCMSDLRRALHDDATAPRYIETVRGRGYRFIHPVDPAPTRAVRTPVETDSDRSSLPFVGRRTELDILDRALRALRQGRRGGFVLLRGEAGIGKTRLLNELLQAVPDSLNVLQASPSVVEGAPPFWPWTQLIRRALADPRFANETLLERGASLSAIFSELEGPARPPTRRLQTVDPFSILSLWAETIQSLLDTRPLMLALEDLHRMDRDSLSLARWLLGELRDEPLLIVATQRPPIDDDHTARLLADLASSSDATVLDLAPLTAAEIAALLVDRVTDRDAVSLDLLRRSTGNPFLLTHLIRRLEGIPDREESRSLAGIRSVDADEIAARALSGLSSETRRALEAASVVGLHFSLAAVADLLQRTQEETLARLTPAIRAQLIHPREADLMFVHELLRDALYARLAPLARRTLHLSMSRHLRGRARPGMHAEAIADHLVPALTTRSPGTACATHSSGSKRSRARARTGAGGCCSSTLARGSTRASGMRRARPCSRPPPSRAPWNRRICWPNARFSSHPTSCRSRWGSTIPR
jgi:DNA-binding winged helix-turn-helix (wHTH) protein